MDTAVHLTQWGEGKDVSMPFGVPVMWSEPDRHIEGECYVCLNYKFGQKRGARKRG